MNEAQGTFALVGTVIASAAGGFAAAYKWLKGQIDVEIKRTSAVLSAEVEALKHRVEMLENKQSAARSLLMDAFRAAVAAGTEEVADLIQEAEGALR